MAENCCTYIHNSVHEGEGGGVQQLFEVYFIVEVRGVGFRIVIVKLLKIKSNVYTDGTRHVLIFLKFAEHY
jgi:hypothetical protein